MNAFLVLVVVLSSQCILSEAEHTIGGIFYKGAEDMKTALEVSAARHNLLTSVKEVSKRGEVLEISNYVCELAKEGVIGIIDGTGGRASENVQALCDMLDIPHIVVQNNDFYSKNWTLLNLFPSPVAYNTFLEELVIRKDWRNFTILYVEGHGLLRVSQLMQLGNSTNQYVVTMRELSGNDYRDVLTDAKRSGYTNFVVDCPSRNIEQLLLHAQQVGLMAEEHSYIFLSPDLFTLDLDQYRYGGVNMTGLRLIADPNVVTKSEKQFSFIADISAESIEKIKTKLLLIHDAVEVLAAALKKIKDIKAEELNCENYDSWLFGSALLNFMKTNVIDGLTQTLRFDGLGQRNDVTFELLELTPAGSEVIGTWTNNQLKISREGHLSVEITEETVLRNKTLKVLIALTPPFAYIKESAEQLEGNARYEGFAVDLIDRLSEKLGFNYEFEVMKDYGKKDPVTGKWSGMALHLIEEKADLAICDFTITAIRQTIIDFSTPFMTLGISILYKQPNKQPPAMFSFMEVFSKEVWYYMMLIQFCLGVVLIFVGRISNKEWQNPVPCIEQPEELSNQFSFANSVWLIIGSVMQQGSEIAPIALAPRLITSVWWFFTMVMVALYTGTLVAFLTVEKKVMPFNNVEELSRQKSIAYGCKNGGSTYQFFADSSNEMYREMFKKMESRGWLVEENYMGVDKAESEQYAFFMESSSIEYEMQRHCDLLQVGGLLDSKSYGIGMKKGSPYKRHVDDALLKLKEKGEIDTLKTLWWNEKRGGGKCGENRDEEQKQLGMKHMIGAFVVLGAGCGIGLLISILDMLWGVFKRSVKYQTTFKYEFIEEVKFVIKFSGNVKPLKRTAKTVDGSAEQLAKAEGKDEVRSLKSIGSGRSTDTHRTHRSCNSRHSSRSISIALARRRQYT